MFEKIRKPGRAKSLFAYIVFGLICLVFVFLGVPIDSISGGGFAAIVNKRVISIADFKQSLEQTRKNRNSLDPSNNEERQKEDQRIVLNQLIDGELVFQSAQSSGLDVPDSELKDQIFSFPAFQENGKFKNSLYRSYLNFQRLSAGSFENKVKKWVLSARVEQLFYRIFTVSELEKERNSEVNQFQLQFKYVKIALPSENSSNEFQKWKGLISFPDQFEKELKAQKLQWIQTPLTSLSRLGESFPGVDIFSDDFFESILKQLPRSGLIPKLMVSGNDLVVVRLEKWEANKKSRKKDLIQGLGLLSFPMARMSWLSWLESLREKSRVKINPQII